MTMAIANCRIGGDAGGGDEAAILRDLFEGTGVVSALDHTRIEGANDPEAAALEREAARVARRAAAALSASRAACRVSPRKSLIL